MKSTWKKIALLALLPFIGASCSQDYPTLDENALPQASELDVQIVADQETNYVTFTVTNPGVVPMWIFGDQKIDGKATKTYAYAENGLRLRFRDAQTYTVEVKAYNKNGISLGSKMVDFTLENTYRDPFDATPWVRSISGGAEQQWVWNSSKDGHFGCGESPSNPTNWWSCGANEKNGWGLYDDVMTFNVDGTYTYDPGEGGEVYVNQGVMNYHRGSYLEDGNDFKAPAEVATSKYWFENGWNEAGIEEIYLCFDEGTLVSYLSHDSQLVEPRYKLSEGTTVSSLKKEIKMTYGVWNAGNNNWDIAWLYNFVPAVKKATPEELLAGTDATGKAWVIDAEAVGHLGCGETIDTPAGWWSAPPYDKQNNSIYDNEMIFYPDGKYVFNPGADGKIFVNKECLLDGKGLADQGNDYDVDWTTEESTYTFDGTTLAFPAGTVFGYVPSDACYQDPTFTVVEITETKLVVKCFHLTVGNPNGIAWQMILRPRDMVAPAVAINGTPLENGAMEGTFDQGGDITVTGIDLSSIWIDPDFFTYVNDTTLKFNAVSGDYRINYDGSWLKVRPLNNGNLATYANGKALWIIGDGGGKPDVSHLIGWVTGEAPLPCAQISANTYQITLFMKAEGGSIKVFGQPDWGTEWTKANYGTVVDNGFFNIPEDDGNIHTIDGTAPGYYTFTFVDNDGTLDMTVTAATMADPEARWDVNSDDNMWKNAAPAFSFWYAPGWAQIADPETEIGDNNYTFTFPTATTDQWQAQTFIVPTNDIVTTADNKYDFQVILTSTTDIGGVTIKLVQDGDDGLFYFDGRHKLEAYEPYTYRVVGMAGKDMSKVKLVLDFGGCPDNSVVNVKDIILQVSK